MATHIVNLLLTPLYVAFLTPDDFGILAVHEAGQQGTSALGEAKAVDVAPTILNLLGIEAPRHFEGRSLIE